MRGRVLECGGGGGVESRRRETGRNCRGRKRSELECVIYGSAMDAEDLMKAMLGNLLGSSFCELALVGFWICKTSFYGVYFLNRVC
jgi:hypothetical protein